VIARQFNPSLVDVHRLLIGTVDPFEAVAGLKLISERLTKPLAGTQVLAKGPIKLEIATLSQSSSGTVTCTWDVSSGLQLAVKRPKRSEDPMTRKQVDVWKDADLIKNMSKISHVRP
jgi:hypothetical protein